MGCAQLAIQLQRDPIPAADISGWCSRRADRSRTAFRIGADCRRQRARSSPSTSATPLQGSSKCSHAGITLEAPHVGHLLRPHLRAGGRRAGPLDHARPLFVDEPAPVMRCSSPHRHGPEPVCPDSSSPPSTSATRPSQRVMGYAQEASSSDATPSPASDSTIASGARALHRLVQRLAHPRVEADRFERGCVLIRGRLSAPACAQLAIDLRAPSIATAASDGLHAALL